MAHLPRPASMPPIPDWQPLEELGATAAGRAGGRVVGILASEGAVADGWAGHAALTLARSWSDAGHKVMLVDASLERPRLHIAAGVRNGEGLSDATLYGASVGRVAQQVDEGGHFLITAGTAVADPHAVARNDRWQRLARGFVESGVTLGLYLQEGETGAAAFLGSASEIVVLCGPAEGTPATLHDLEGLVTLVTGPAAPAPVGVAATEPGEGSAPRAAPEESAGGAPAPAPAARTETRRRRDPLTVAPEGGRGGLGRTGFLVLILIAVIAAAMVAAFLGIVEIPGLSLGATISDPSLLRLPAGTGLALG